MDALSYGAKAKDLTSFFSQNYGLTEKTSQSSIWFFDKKEKENYYDKKCLRSIWC
ncbi:hypothetical protein SCODD09_01756 [Streptococcus constellatus]|nr:hypothetical protein SCODD09_01756 [Streptococcus constellatus]